MCFDWPDIFFYSGGLGANRKVLGKLGMKLAIASGLYPIQMDSHTFNDCIRYALHNMRYFVLKCVWMVQSNGIMPTSWFENTSLSLLCVCNKRRLW